MNILISAVGGQGALLASRIFGTLADKIGLDIKLSEVHGMSQRGGSVVTHVRMGKKVNSPVVEKGTADFIMAFEQLEGARYIDWLKKDGTLIVNTQQIDPMPVVAGTVEYPGDLVKELSELPIKLYSVDAVTLATQAGNVKTANIILVGILASITDIPKQMWQEAIVETVPEKFVEENLKAFELGYKVK
ncbi:MAG TPA: indolepyruvate oxidoreductase subunit beta [Epulopiscium sp.]|nr:indolepyruvate oxidoreductase subunit beta [Candidatus Epulonipiscium sp.]